MKEKINSLLDELNKVILGNEKQIKLAVICLLAKGHLLIEDLPGTGKSTLSKTLAKCFGLNSKSVHFTSDLLPSDIIGINVFNSEKSSFQFEPGPIFSNFFLADEINRASPRTQSALLEAMNDNEINIEGVTMKLPSQFFVIATQNPLDQVGTSPLPESQLDRFLMRISLGKPNREAEKEILKGENKTPSAIKQIMSKDDLIFIQKELINKKLSNEIYEYILDLLSESRRLREGGLSTRAAIAVINASKACAYVNGATDVTPDHVQYIFKSVAEHRLDNGYIDSSSLSEKIIQEVDAIR
ncbi:AAA family ATPase [Prochlorococcus marinus]|uniref:AAA family ATPase n=1 Tax=Prochlorococcus marinus str. GP2 TaxID=59925 RepID=A0A0A1ZE24_PROMR|nr:MoxR family ATPase [Prochlorococcus marinus]KGF87650.1 hypothetical protein EU91_0682 [Prochlorococcus marinus str. GP2]